MEAIKTQVVIHAWKGGQEIFDMLLPYWEAHNLPILVVCPSDSIVETRHPLFLAGPHGQAGEATFIRWRNEVGYLWRQPFDAWVIFEYDSLCLDPKLTVLPGLRGIIADNLEGSRFMCDRYVIPPWTFDRETLGKLHKASLDHPEVNEWGYDDRILAAWAKLGGVPMFDHVLVFHAPGGGSTIMPEQYEALRDAVRAGATMFHGIKSRECLDVIKAAMRP
jgi:hypothetical protein